MLHARKALESAESSVFMTESVCTRRKLAMETLKFGRGVIGKSIIQAVIDECPRYEPFRDKQGTDWIVNRSAQKIEQELFVIGNELMAQGDPISSNVSYPDELNLDPARMDEALTDARSRGEFLSLEALLLSRQQFRAAYQYVMRSSSNLLLLEGAAGTGKSFFLKILARDICSEGREVYAFAPTGTASRVNLKPDFEDAQTVSHLLLNERLQEKVKGAVLVIDEAPLLDGNSLVKLLELARRLGCKVILQGDLAQQHSVGPVDGVRLLRQELGLGKEMERLSVNRRQLKEADKAIALDWSEKRVTEALAKMKEAGVLIEGRETRDGGVVLETNASGDWLESTRKHWKTEIEFWWSPPLTAKENISLKPSGFVAEKRDKLEKIVITPSVKKRSKMGFCSPMALHSFRMRRIVTGSGWCSRFATKRAIQIERAAANFASWGSRRAH